MKHLVLIKAADSERECNYVKFFTERGLEVSVIPPITFDFCNLEVLAEKLQKLSDYAGIILTSPRCVEAVDKALLDVPGAVNLNLCKAFVVGEKTAADAILLGFKTEGKESGSAANLAEYIISSTHGGHFLFPKSTIAADTIESSLLKAGATVDAVEVYRTIQHPDLPKKIAALKSISNCQFVFFSPSGANEAIPLMRKQGTDFLSNKFYAIGPTTEKALSTHQITVCGTAKSPTPESLYETLTS